MQHQEIDVIKQQKDFPESPSLADEKLFYQNNEPQIISSEMEME